MNQPPQDGLWPTPEFFENQKNFPPEEVDKYRGLHIAWSYDGSKIIDSDADEMRLWDRVLAAGLDPARTLIDYVDPSDCIL
jgi:hypothetical protein